MMKVRVTRVRVFYVDTPGGGKMIRSMSVGDVVVLNTLGRQEAYLCDRVGFKPCEFEVD
jgi:hypothetical protein